VVPISNHGRVIGHLEFLLLSVMFLLANAGIGLEHVFKYLPTDHFDAVQPMQLKER
jgi:hypothetical protein